MLNIFVTMIKNEGEAMSKESIIQNMKEHLDYRDAFGKYITCNEDYFLAMHALSAPSIAEEYAKWELMN